MGSHLIFCSYSQVLGSSGHCFQNTNQGLRMQVLDLGSWALCWEGRVWVSLNRVESEGSSWESHECLPNFFFLIQFYHLPHPVTPPSFNPFMFSESAALRRLYTNLCVPSDAFLLGEVKYL